MDPSIKFAYDWLTPADQLVVDAVIITIYNARVEAAKLAEAAAKAAGIAVGTTTPEKLDIGDLP